MNDNSTRHKRYYQKHKEQQKEESKKYYQKHKERIKAWKKEYRAKNRDKLLKLRKIKRDKLSIEWRKNAVPNSAKLAEDIITKKVLPKMGFTDIFRPTKNFYFDSLANKNGNIHAIEVATTQTKQLDKYRLSFCKYFKLDISIFIVKPDLSCYYLIEQKYPNYRSNPNYKKGIKINLS